MNTNELTLSNETLNAHKCTCSNGLQYENCNKLCERFDAENEEVYSQPMQLLRELAMRTNVAFPETEEDLRHFEEGFNPDFGKKLLHVLDLGKFEVENVG